MTSLRQQRGMTILEVVVYISILVIIMGAIVASLEYVYKGQRFAFEQGQATRSARVGVEHMVQDIREASYADDGAYPIVVMATSSITFFSDYNHDGKIERIRYFLEGSNLKRGIVASAGDPPTYQLGSEVVTIISEHVRNNATGVPLLTYYDKAGALMSTYTKVGDMAFVLVRLVTNVDPLRAPTDYEVRSSASLRNVKIN